MAQTINLAQLKTAVDNNLPASSIIRDPSGRCQTFYKYKGILAERASLEWTPVHLARQVKTAVTQGYALAIVINPNDDITDMIQPNIIPSNIFNKTRLSEDDLEPFREGPDDNFIRINPDFRLVILLTESGVPRCLQRYIDSGDFRFIDVA